MQSAFSWSLDLVAIRGTCTSAGVLSQVVGDNSQNNTYSLCIWRSEGDLFRNLNLCRQPHFCIHPTLPSGTGRHFPAWELLSATTASNCSLMSVDVGAIWPTSFYILAPKKELLQVFRKQRDENTSAWQQRKRSAGWMSSAYSKATRRLNS